MFPIFVYMNTEAIKNLQEALKVSPDNIPLRIYLSQILMSERQYEEAERQYKTLLEYEPHNFEAKKGLVKACYEQDKFSMAYVLLEEICKAESVEAEYHLMFAKILLKDGQKNDAQKQYQLAVSKDKYIKDKELDNEFRASSVYMETDEEDPDNFFNEKLNVEKPSVTFKDVGGMSKVKEEIQLKIVHPITHAELYKAYGKKSGGGILLYGPPGCGKTHIARATAGEVNTKFINVGINDILDMWIGSSEKNLHELFELARKNAPCILFFDEVDALGANRSDMKNSAGRHLINQFLSEMDGVDTSNEGVLILAATNAPWHLDPAFRRPGRFDRIIFVQPPDEDARKKIFEIQLQGKPTSDISLHEISTKTPDFSGADIKSLIDIVIENKLRESISNGIPQPINTKDIVSAIKGMNPSTKEWFTVARNYALYSNESGLYNDILDYLKIKK